MPKSATILGKIFWGAVNVMRFCVLISWCLGMFGLIVGGLVLLYGLLVGVVIDQMDISSFFPAIFPWAIGLGILSAIGFFALGIQLLFRRKIQIGILISAFLFGAFSIAGGGIVGQELYFALHAPNQLLTKEIKIPVSASQKPFLINIQSPLLERENMITIDESTLYNLLPTDEKEIKVVYSFDVKVENDEKGKKKLNLVRE